VDVRGDATTVHPVVSARVATAPTVPARRTAVSVSSEVVVIKAAVAATAAASAPAVDLAAAAAATSAAVVEPTRAAVSATTTGSDRAVAAPAIVARVRKGSAIGRDLIDRMESAKVESAKVESASLVIARSNSVARAVKMIGVRS
jgi:hypothetical protein